MSSDALLAPASDPLIGKTLADRYTVRRKLGEGGMGAVYEGEHTVIKKRVAIKVLHPQYATTPEVVVRFHQEALAATAIGHEHIVEVNDMGRTPDGALFMVLEFLSGRDFADLLDREHPLSIGRVAHIVAQVCDAVQAAHDKEIVHRDLKPENVFLVKRGGDPDFVKVLDFGISKMKDETGGSRSQTKTGAIMGTAYYLSPEQAMGKRTVDHRSDIWAIGVILYRALVGRYPFDDEAYPMLIVKICSDTPVRPSALRSDLPPELDALIMRCLEKDPDKRPASCNSLAAALGPFRNLTSVLPGTRLSAPGPAPAQSVSSEVRAKSPGRIDSPAAFANTVATPADGGRAASPGPATVAAAGLPTGTSRAPMIAGVAVVSAVLVGGAAWYTSSSTPDPVATVTPDAPPIAAAPVEPETDPSPPAPTEHVNLILSPSEAVALVDGRPVHPTPEGDLHIPVDENDSAVHELRVEYRGFRTHIEDLRLSYAQRVVISLDPGTGIEDLRASATGVGGSSGGRRHTGTSTPTVATVPTVGGAPTSTTPAVAGDSASVINTGSSAAEPAVREDVGEPEAATPPEGVVAPPPAAGLKRRPGAR